MNFSLIEELEQFEHSSLNPCFDGICSMREALRALKALMFPCLNPCFDGICSMRAYPITMDISDVSLNPCFDGICSMRSTKKTVIAALYVLILVLMEYAQ